MSWSQETGLALACLSAVFNGSFISFSKVPSVAAAQVSPMLFNLYICAGVFLSSFLVVPTFSNADAEFTFTLYGALAGVLFVVAILGSLITVNLIGVSTGQGVWGAVAILISFSWGTFAPAPLGKPLASAPLSGISVLLLLLGVIGIVFCEPLGARLQNALCGALGVGSSHPQRLDDALASGEVGQPQHAALTAADGGGGIDQQIASGERSDGDGDETDRLGAPLFRRRINELCDFSAVDLRGGRGTDSSAGSSGGGGGARARARARARALGLLSALVVGLSGGSILVPLSYTDERFHGQRSIAFMPSFGVGALGAGGVATGTWYALQPTPPKLHLRATLWAGLSSGLVWNLGNLCSILAIEFAQVPFGVAYPILQSALVVAGLIGIFVLGEITQPGAIAVFFLSAFVVLGGAVLLSVYGPQSS